VHVSIRTSPFNEKEPYYANGMTIALPRQTDDTRLLTKVALWGLRRIYRRGYQYQKAGVMLSELVPRQYRQLDLFGSTSTADTQSSKLMSVMDHINARMGRGTIKLASEGFKQPWKMKGAESRPWKHEAGLPIKTSLNFHQVLITGKRAKKWPAAIVSDSRRQQPSAG
jgi:DNA polymerase V